MSDVIDGGFNTAKKEEFKEDMLLAGQLEMQKFLEEGADGIFIMATFPDARQFPGYVTLNNDIQIPDVVFTMKCAIADLMDRARGLLANG